MRTPGSIVYVLRRATLGSNVKVSTMRIATELGTCAGLLVILSLTGCGQGPDHDASGTARSAIVNGTPDTGHPSVVGVISIYSQGGYLWRTACTGTYIAPRVVLTAAHCIKPNTYYSRVFYGGIDLAAGYTDASTNFPWGAPPADKPWAQVESTKVNPAFSTDTYYGDMAILSLDRELPIPITPVAKWRLEDKAIGTLGTEVGYGATESDMMLTQTKGWGTKRVGQAPFLGSPPAGFETDHPGIGLAQVRDSLAMFDGSEPYSNGCAGDSGGPILMKHGSKEYVYGVASWTGFYCADYSFYTRMDPFVSFIDSAVARAGRGAVEPTLECVRPLENGKSRAYFGFNSANDVSVEIAYGSSNRLPADTLGLRPTKFAPGEHHFAALADYELGDEPFWKIQAPSGKTGVLNAPNAAVCDPNDVTTVAADACISRIAARCGETMDYCVADWMWSYYPDDVCAPLVVDYMKCTAKLTPDQYECMGDVGYDFTDTCNEPLMALFTCWGY